MNKMTGKTLSLPPLLKKMLHSTLFILISVWVLLSLLVFVFQNSFVFLPSKSLHATPADLNLPYEDISFKTNDDLNLHGWYVPAENPDATLLFFHGNAGNISQRLDTIEMFRSIGLSVFVIDYRGYGRSEGSPSETGTYQDAEAAWQFLINDRDIAADEIIIFGRSLGGAVAAWLANKTKPGAVILESTFTSVNDMARQFYPYLPTRWLMRIKYPTIERIGGINSPLLLIHSSDDEIIPYHQGQILFNAANEPKSFLKIQGDHNYGFIESESIYLQGIKNFITRYMRQETTLSR